MMHDMMNMMGGMGWAMGLVWLPLVLVLVLGEALQRERGGGGLAGSQGQKRPAGGPRGGG
jgi:hypothetical protein